MKLAASLLLGAFLGLLCASCGTEEPCWSDPAIDACILEDANGDAIDARCLEPECCAAVAAYGQCGDCAETERIALSKDVRIACHARSTDDPDRDACQRACGSL